MDILQHIDEVCLEMTCILPISVLVYASLARSYPQVAGVSESTCMIICSVVTLNSMVTLYYLILYQSLPTFIGISQKNWFLLFFQKW